jgi:F-type H+-transporting ATPase subunit a
MMLLAFSSQLPFTTLLNGLLGGPVTRLLEMLGIHPHDAHAPIPNFVAMQILVAVVLVTYFAFVRSRLSVESPGFAQHLAEFVYGFIKNLGHELIGHGYEPFLPYLATLGMFILTCNLIGLVPSLESPTANPSVPLGCAVMSFCYYNFQGIRHHGFGYIKQFLGPVLFLAPLMFLIEVISHTARMLSLTVRLYANIFAGDMLTLAFFSLVPVGIPIAFQGLHLLVSFIQTYIFVLLSTVYLAGAMEEAH